MRNTFSPSVAHIHTHSHSETALMTDITTTAAVWKWLFNVHSLGLKLKK